MSEFGRIVPEEYAINLKAPALEVAESRLFRGVDPKGLPVALKIFPTLTMEQITRYQRLTNFLANYLNKKTGLVKINIQGIQYSLKPFIVPINTIGIVRSVSNQDHPCTISEFIEGPSLADIQPHYLSDNYDNLAQDPLVRLSLELKRYSQNSGIGIIPWNVKPLLDQTPNALAITDLAGSITSATKQA